MPDELDWMRESDAADQWQEASERRERFEEHNSVWAAPRQGAAVPAYDDKAAEARHQRRQAAAARQRQQVREALEEYARNRTLNLFSSQPNQIS